MTSLRKKGFLALEDGTVFHGYAFGAAKTVVGEAVFNTSLTGYQEILTDPSYFSQIVTFTASHIGNYGVNPKDSESDGVKALGLIVRELSPVASNYLSCQTLEEYLLEQDIPGVEGVDTRAVTKKLRSAGVMKACLTTESISEQEAIHRARDWCGLEGIDCVGPVSCKESYVIEPFNEDSRPFSIPGTDLGVADWPPLNRLKLEIVAFDFGAKRSIFRQLASCGFRVTVVPAHTTAQEVEMLNPQGIFLSNGPGDPKILTGIHETIRQLMPKYPIFGICLGHQIITHALGANTFKLKFGHRGGNQPVKNLERDFVSITAQNHGYASCPEELEAAGAVITEINLNDNTVAGLRHKTLPVFSVQYHPEAAPGPNDGTALFTRFYQMVAEQVSKAA